MKIKFVISLLVFSVVGCLTKSTDETAEGQTYKKQTEEIIFPQVNDDFDRYLRNFEKTQLPIEIKGCELSTKGLAEFNGEAYIKYINDYSIGYKQIPTNGNFIMTITLGAADCYLPILTTYRLTGDRIDQKTLAIGYCGSDCGYSCEEFMTIKDDYSIYVSDTISSSDCDSLGNIIPESTKNYVIFKSGKILESGNIELSEEIRKKLEK